MTEEPLQKVSVWRSRKINKGNYESEDIGVSMEVRIESPFQSANEMVLISAELREHTEQMLDEEEARIRGTTIEKKPEKESSPQDEKHTMASTSPMPPPPPDPEHVCCPDCGGTKKNPEDKRKKCESCNGTGKSYVENRVDYPETVKAVISDVESSKRAPEINGTEVPTPGTNVTQRLAEIEFVPHRSKEGLFMHKSKSGDMLFVDLRKAKPSYYTSRQLDKQGVELADQKKLEDARLAVEGDSP